MKKSMATHSITPNGSLPQANQEFTLGKTIVYLRQFLLLVLMLLAGANTAWGQDYSGVYYIGTAGYNANTPANNFYLCPTEEWIYYKPDDKWSDDGTTYPNPFLTTYKCKTNSYHSGDPSNAVWYIEKHPTQDYYYIKHASDGKYVISNGKIDGTSNANRMRVHLESVAPKDLDDKALFSIYSYSDYLVISPKSPDGWNGNYKWYTVNNGNKPYLVGNGSSGGPSGYGETGGIIGLYSENDANAKFYLEKALSIDAPTITNNYTSENTFTISAAEGATIYYTTDGTTPTTATTATGTTSVNVDQTENMTVIKAIAKATSDAFPSVVTTYTIPQCARPVITVSGGNVTITCATAGATIHYTIDETPATTSSTPYTVPFAKGDASTIRAIATKAGYIKSAEAIFLPPTEVSSSSQITDMSGNYLLASGFTSSSSIGTSDDPFKGTIDGDFNTLELSYPLVAYAKDATIKNVILKDVNLTSGTNVGAICNEATGETRIYNCGVLSGSVSGTNAGGLVGHIKSGSSVRVVNCYSYANVSGSGYAAGIVGWNEGTVGEVRIAMCMMYGDMSDGTSPVYAGNHISNVSNFTEYNYWRSKANLSYTTYNDQLAIDKDEYLSRFPFYRHILNTHRELAAYFLFANNTTTGSVGDITAAQVNEIGHWVLKKDVAPYPIVEKWETNTSKILDAPAGTTVSVRKGAGSPITSLEVKVIIGGNTYTKNPKTGMPLTLPITDMDETNHDYTWGKVVLPFANEFKVNSDYTKICTGWKITGITGGNGGTYENYNVSDRDCTTKDLYETTGFIFAQGCNFIVPYNVTGIEITANFATAYYLSDESYDIGYSGDNTSSDNKTSGYKGRTKLGGDTPTTYHEQPVYNTLASALNAMSASGSTHEQAVVLVGNYHQDGEDLKNYTSKGYTIMSIDADNNQEPDYAIYSNFTLDRPAIPPTRFDFVAMIPLGLSSHINGSNFYPNVPIFKPRGWFELTETSLLRADQFELDSNNFNTSTDDTRNYRCIINGGYFTQMVRSNAVACTKVSYFQIGGNAYIKEFYPGNHSKKNHANKLVPINVTGGEIEQCFMTGYGLGTAYGENIYFWCAGGKIGKFLGAYMEKPRQSTSADGNVNLTAKIDHAVIGRFFGGGTSPNARVTGNINVTINNSHVDFYCGGPEFGDMSAGKTVRTEATNTYFKEYYGAGFGGTGITYTNDKDEGVAITNNLSYKTGYFNECYVASGATDKGRLRFKTNYGLGSCYKFEYVMHSRGYQCVSRFFTGYAKFSLATTGNVTNVLNGCEIENDFYGAGCQGKVSGTVTSTLTNCTVHGSAFGGGFKAESNQVDVYPTTQPSLSKYNSETCLFSDFGTVAPETYEWVQGTSSQKNVADEDNKKLYTGTDVTMTDLGNVTGAIKLTIDGGSVTNNVFGGGNESKSLNNTIVNILGNVQIGTANSHSDVYGGGNVANVDGNTKVTLLGGTINGNVYGGGKGRLEEGTSGQAGYVSPVEATVGDATVYLNGMEKSDYDADAADGKIYENLGLVQASETGPYTVADSKKGCVVKGDIFGCNNLNGTPKGDVTVHVYATQNENASQIANAAASETQAAVTNAKVDGRYDVNAVYGGGNLAPYIPSDGNLSTAKATVIIDGCDRTSIRTVYGGGNAASTPATSVTVNGTYEINELFGGGNGLDALPDGRPNPGANVGYKNYTIYEEKDGQTVAKDDPNYDTKEKRINSSNIVYGTGAASVNIYGGNIHAVFGGSNTKGNVRISAVTLLDDQEGCHFNVDEAYGGGKSAPMDAEAQLHMACIPGLKAAYGGAEAANIEGNVTLNITNGNFDRVFGGNNISGTISGTITVNIEEIGCKPIIIGQLYGGGNLAAYTAPTGQHGPTVNVKSFTSIGEVYGGGYGTGAVVTGDTYVNINEVLGDKASDNQFMKEKVTTVEDPATQTTGDDKVSKNTGVTKTFKDGDGENANTISVEIPLHKSGKIGVINNVFGGGNAAEVNGNTNVNIGTVDKVYVVKSITAGTTFTPTDRYYTRNDDGTYTQATGTATSGTTYYEEKDIVGVDIRGNVYGGGNNAEVTGNTNVTIGKRED